MLIHPFYRILAQPMQSSMHCTSFLHFSLSPQIWTHVSLHARCNCSMPRFLSLSKQGLNEWINFLLKAVDSYCIHPSSYYSRDWALMSTCLQTPTKGKSSTPLTHMHTCEHLFTLSHSIPPNTHHARHCFHGDRLHPVKCGISLSSHIFSLELAVFFVSF